MKDSRCTEVQEYILQREVRLSKKGVYLMSAWKDVGEPLPTLALAVRQLEEVRRSAEEGCYRVIQKVISQIKVGLKEEETSQ